MLYIFYVDTGATITFNIGLALQSVAELKEAIERECGVLAEHQVLLMSGGESLESNARVCSYSAGTDTNPIYLFNQGAIESQVPPIPHTDYSTDVDLADQINASLAMSATYATLVSRAQLAQQCYNIAKEQTRTCEHLVHDQHLQQQGWAAVVANLEDITQMFQTRADLLQQNVAHYLTEREQHMQLLNNFNNDLQTLSKIPILPALRAQADGLISPDDNEHYELQQNETLLSSSQQQQQQPNDNQVLSLLRWISAKDNQSSLELIFDQCSRGLEQFDERMMESLKNEVNLAIDASDRPELKEIKGLGERLFGLEQLMSQAKRLVQDQGELAQGFSQNQTRANNLGDPSVLPDLCASHRKQLIVMLGNHNQLRDIRRRCTRAKEELSENIYHRLKWIMFVEKKIWEVDGKLVMYHENLKRLRRHLEILEQIHLAPQMYIDAVAEVVRRRTFSNAFLLWASNLACQLMTVHNDEVQLRRNFQAKFDGHFLNILFPGLEDTPPSFATQAPNLFDNQLPKLTSQDMDSLKCQLPDFAESMNIPNLNSITQFFLSNSLSNSNNNNNNDNNETTTNNDKKQQNENNNNATTTTTTIDDVSNIVDQSSTSMTTDQRMIDDGTFIHQDQMDNLSKTKELEENLGNARAEVQRLRTILQTMKTTTSETMMTFRNELLNLREKINDDKNNSINDVTERINQALTLHSQESERILHERQHEMTVDHEFELSDIKKLLNARDEEIDNLKQTMIDKENNQAEHERLINTMRQKIEAENEEIINIKNIQTQQQLQLSEKLNMTIIDKDNAIEKVNILTDTIEQYKLKINQLEDNLETAKLDQQKIIKETTDKLQLEYKTELETIRSRFKLMTASTLMERSPSDSSLEKIERTDLIELVNHEAIIAQLRQDFETEKDKAIRQAIENKTHDMQLKINQLERQIENLMLREITLFKECEKYRENIHQHSATDTNDVLFNKNNNNKMEMNESIDGSTTRTIVKTDCGVSGATKSSKDDNIEASESKKVRLESLSSTSSESLSLLGGGGGGGNADCLTRHLEKLEIDNKRLTAELRAVKDSKKNIIAKMEALESDKVFLEIELVKERSRNNINQPEIIVSMDSSRENTREYKDMSCSVAVVSETSSQEAGTSLSSDINRQDPSTFKYHEKLIKSTTNIFQQLSISLNTCNTGDCVIVLWDTKHSNYIVLQETKTMYFLHSDCTDTLDLRPSRDGLPKQTYVLGQVIDKQYCHAKKPENRYKVPQGTKFYRVRVRRLARDLDLTISSSDRSQDFTINHLNPIN
ncbi:RB1-inducible coiled-coil protein 1 isoform X2 [Aphidius gifuensis]|uniref:RB1-inducible coiled-coil protein 1 isoform X2 n=1 Tax=Aphidius gifuensis TaxID=684658 RepID=UPI001CDD4178|nr:RB1-inducible coiled-coil protein 1 isoform X2 [Aphidius gifuensis]